MSVGSLALYFFFSWLCSVPRMLPKVVDQWFSHWVSECLTVLSTVFRIICWGCSSSWNFGYRLMSWCIHNSIVEFLSWPLSSKSQQSVPALFWHKNFWFCQLLWCFLYQFPPNSSRTHRIFLLVVNEELEMSFTGLFSASTEAKMAFVFFSSCPRMVQGNRFKLILLRAQPGIWLHGSLLCDF